MASRRTKEQAGGKDTSLSVESGLHGASKMSHASLLFPGSYTVELNVYSALLLREKNFLTNEKGEIDTSG